MSPEERADFVFLTDAEDKTIKIVEIKSPDQPELNSDHDRQLSDYMDFTSSFRSSSTIVGLLVGNRGSGGNRYESNDKRTVVKSWNEVLLQCRAAYLDMLAAMLGRSDVAPEDGRLTLVQQFAGQKVWSLLLKIAEKNERLRNLMTRLQHLVGPAKQLF